MRSKRAASLLEMMTYSFLFSLLTLGILSLYVSAKEYYEGSVGSYLINAEFEPGLRSLRQELRETSLISLRPYPNPKVSLALPGCSFLSARSYDKQTQYLTSPHGAPQWDKQVFYTLQPANKETGNVIRWEKKLDPPSLMPSAPLDLPQTIANPAHSRTMLKGILLPKMKLPALKTETDEHGGFRVAFVGYDGGDRVLTDFNPGQIHGGTQADIPASATTRLVEVQIKGLNFSGTGRASFFSIHFRVLPNN